MHLTSVERAVYVCSYTSQVVPDSVEMLSDFGAPHTSKHHVANLWYDVQSILLSLMPSGRAPIRAAIQGCQADEFSSPLHEAELGALQSWKGELES